MTAHEIQLNEAHLSVGGRQLVKPLSVTLQPGCVTAIIGPNGAGKSTLLRMIGGLEPTTQGEIRYDLPGGPIQVQRASPRRLAKHRAMMLHNQQASFDYTVMAYLLMGLNPQLRRWALPGKAHLLKAEAMLEAVELTPLAGQAITTLSAGEFQRMQLAQVMLMDRPWWMLDEPLSNLDLKHQVLAMEHISAHCARGGGALVILHDLDMVMRYAQQVVVLRDGAMVAAGHVEAVCTAAQLSEVFDAQMHAHQHNQQTYWHIDLRTKAPDSA